MSIIRSNSREYFVKYFASLFGSHQTLVEEHLPAGVVAAKHSAAKFCDTLVDSFNCTIINVYNVYD